MKKLIQIILGIAILVLVYVVFMQIWNPLKFQETQAAREAMVIDKLEHIRLAERSFKQKYQHYTGSFDTLINFILHDSLKVKKAIGSADDSVAVARGLVKTEEYFVMVADTVFAPLRQKAVQLGKKYNALTVEQIKNLRYVPFSDGQEFILAAGNFKTESEVIVPVFECKAPYKMFLFDLPKQDLINLIDARKTLDKYPGLAVGALDKATNDAGNWE